MIKLYNNDTRYCNIRHQFHSNKRQIMHCIFVNSLTAPLSLPENLTDKKGLYFPEKSTSMVEQSAFIPEKMGKTYDFVITNSPLIVGCFRADNVSVYDAEQDRYQPPVGETYGGSFDVLLKQMNKMNSLLPKVVVEDIRQVLNGDPEAAITHLESFAPSGEKAYLLRQLKAKINASAMYNG